MKKQNNIIYFKKGDNFTEKFVEAWWMKEVYGWSYLVFLTRESEDKD